jgi:hypothetical protein
VESLISPVILFFALGVLAGLVKSDLAIPETLSKGISLYLMIAIGFRGGAELAHTGVTGSILWPMLAAALLSALLPVLGYALLRFTTKLDGTNAAAIAAHYGSVSVVTFATAVALLNLKSQPFEPYIVALLVVMEAPAILTGLVLARAKGSLAERKLGRGVVREVLLHGSVLLLLGSFLIGAITGQRGMDELSPVFVDPFKGVLCVFLLDMGLVVARRLSDLKALSFKLTAFGIYMPIIGAALGLGSALLLGLSPGGATLLAVLAASASYIVVPAVMRAALPSASPALYLTLAIGVTFPWNIVVGIPLYHEAARLLVSGEGAASSSSR